MEITKTSINNLSYKVIGAAIEVHKELGPGLLESVYHKCLAHEFELRNIKFKSEYSVPIIFKSLKFDTAMRCDFLVENILSIELKSVQKMEPIFTAQLITYMNLLKAPKGILINFNVENIFKEGQKPL